MKRKNHDLHRFTVLLSGICLILVSFLTSGQGIRNNLSVPSPNATALGSSVDTPVSFSSGSASVSIPLYDVEGKEISVPVSLSYNSSGVRPDVHPGWTGTNWSLNAGGMITRVVKGIPDETAWRDSIELSTGDIFTRQYFHGYGYWTPKLSGPDWDGEANVKALARSENWVDTDPDEYVFNFCGHTGRFYMDDQGVFHVLGDPSLKVEMEDTLMSVPNAPYLISPAFYGQSVDALYYSWERRIKGFKITTGDGTQYEFGLWNREQTLANIAIEESIDFFQEGYYGESWDSWYLIRILAPHNTDVITFHYEPGAPIASFGRSIAMNKQSGSSVPRGLFKIFGPVSASSYSVMERWNGRLMSPIYLKKIVAANAEVEFHRSPTTEMPYNYNAIFSDLAFQADNSFQPAVYAHTARLAIAASVSDVINGKPWVGAFPRNDIKLVDPFTLNLLVSPNVWLFLQNYLLEGPANPYITGQFMNGYDVWEAIDFTKLVWYKLDSILIRERSAGEIVKSYGLSYNHNAAERLMLMSVTEKSKGKSNPPYTFEYEDYNSNYYPGTEKLPPYNSYKVDHWGFFNGRDTRAGLDFSNEQTLQDFKSAKDPVPAYLYAGILNKISYPTGGHTRFVYEPHTYGKTVVRNKTTGAFSLRTESTPQIAGGLRIREIRRVAGINQPDMVKQYTYEGGILNGESQYYWKDYTGRFLESDATYKADRFVTNTILPVSSNSTGSHISYSTVREIIPGNGYSVHTFSNHDTNPDQNFTVSIDPEKSPYSPFISKEAERGKLLSLKRYSEDNALLYEETNQYQPGASTLIKAVATIQIPVFEGWSVEGTSYRVLTYDHLQVQQTVTEALPGGGSITTQHEQQYNPHDRVSARSRTDGKGTALKTALKYAGDVTGAPYTAMVARHMIGRVIEQAHYKNSTEFLSSTRTNYDFWNGSSWGGPVTNPVYPRSEESRLGAGPVVTETEYLSYDSRGNLRSVRDKTGMTTDVTYYSAAGKTDLIQTRTDAYSTPLARTDTYNYQPLAGVSSVTDPNTKQVQYAYDDFGRLQTEKNPDGSIRASYCYNYANQSTVPCSPLVPAGIIVEDKLMLLGSREEPMPVTLADFQAEAVEKQALLSWITTEETGFSHFDVERSVDGLTWEALGRVPSARSGSGHYTFTDTAPWDGENFYRLKMTDLDDSYAYSRIRSVVFGETGRPVLYPNPVTVNDVLTVQTGRPEQVAALQLFDTGGSLVMQSAGLQLDTGSLKPGLYIVQVTYSDGSITTHRIIKQ